MCFKKKSKPAPTPEPDVKVETQAAAPEADGMTAGQDVFKSYTGDDPLAEIERRKEVIAEDPFLRGDTMADARARQEENEKRAEARKDRERERLDLEKPKREVTPEDPLDTSKIDERLPDRPIGTSSVSYTTVVQQKPSEAAKEQEELAAAELRRARQERARQKQSLLRKRLERSAEYGSGKKVLTGEERELRGMREDARVTEATGKRRGTGRRSLIAGSRGGIGFYSRYS